MGGPKEDLQAKEVLLAVVIADAEYETNFAPLTGGDDGTPVCLLHLAGKPLLDYTLECLLLSGVKEVILYLSTGPARVKQWLGASRWSQTSSPAPLAITVIVNEESRSVGDACRDLDEKGIVRQDFVLVAGDLVGGRLGLERIMDGHKARAITDKHSIMTSVYMQCEPGHPLRARGRELVVATDKKTGQVLFYQRSDDSSNNFPVELFQHDEVSVLFDLADPGIYVCHPTVLALFSDNFDIQSLDALTGEILESDLVDSTIYLETMSDTTVARASNPYMFLTLSGLVLDRWFHPQVPDCPLSGVTYQRHNVYRGAGCVVGKGVVMQEDVMLGKGVVVEEGAVLQQVVVGRECKVGRGASLVNCVIMDRVEVGEGVRLEDVLVGEDVVIPAGATVGRRVTLGSGVRLGGGAEVRDCSRVASSQQDDWGEEEGGEEESSSLGPRAFIYTEEEDDEDEESVKSGRDVAEYWWGEKYETDEDDSSDESSEVGSDGDLEDFNDDSGDESDKEAEDGLHEDVKNFRREVVDSVTRGLEQGVATDNLVLEINGSKHAWNITLSEVNQCVLYAVLTVKIDQEAALPSLLSSVLANIKKLTPLLTKYSRSKSGQQYYLEGLELLVEKHSAYMDILSKILHALYEADVLADQTILAWSKKTDCSAAVEEPKVLKQRIVAKVGPFLKWLEEDSESEEDSE